MKTRATLVLSCAATMLAQFNALAAADDLPRPQLFGRYEGMISRSPFAVATAVAPPPQAPNFAKDLFVANAAKYADESVATLSSNVDKNLKEYLTTRGPNKSGYGISNIEWSDRVGATKVTITKDGQFATLAFNQALLSQPVANAPMPQTPAVPPSVQPVTPQQLNAGQPVVSGITPVPNYTNPNAIRPAPIPTLPTPPPRVRGVIQRNPNGAVQPVPDDRAQLQDQ